MSLRNLVTVPKYPGVVGGKVPYVLESNPHPFYSFRGLKIQMRIRIACGLDSHRELDFGKMIEPCRKNNTVQ